MLIRYLKKNVAFFPDSERDEWDATVAAKWQAGDVAGVLADADRKLRNERLDLAALYWRARALDVGGVHEQAIAAYKTALRNIPKDPVTLPFLSAAGAVSHYMHRAVHGAPLLSISPNMRNKYLTLYLVDLLVRLKRFSEALEICKASGLESAAEDVTSERDEHGFAMARARLDSLIGLCSVKEQVHDVCAMTQLLRHREQAGFPLQDLTRHLVFTGNPGTGKTTVAREIGDIYKAMGVLKSGHFVEADPGKLVAGFVGHTAAKTQELINQAMDGILFIDEAYGLTPRKDASGGRAGDFEEAAIRVLLKAMEDHRDRLIVIVAGYKDEMDGFVDSNPGLKERFRTFIEFPDYSDSEMVEIFKREVAAAGCTMQPDAEAAIRSRLMQIPRSRGFANARTVRNVWHDCLTNQAKRLQRTRAYSKDYLAAILVEDILPGLDRNP